jgi:outer membrane protein OmpA-like peptidoglycan-associated protein
MVYITNSSTGGDGIIAKTGINRIEDLVGKKVGVPKFSEAQTLVEWLLASSSLSEDQVRAIRREFKYFDTPDDAAKAFFAGQLDAAATWQPYLSQAASMGNAHILFSTKNATNIVLDGIVFRADYVAQNRDKVSKLIEGSLMASDLYKTQFSAIKDTMPLFATETDDSIKGMTEDATLANYATNVSLFGGTAQALYTDMCNVWSSLGEKADSNTVTQAFDNSIIKTLEGKFQDSVATIKFTEAQRQSAKSQSNDNALLTQRLSINFATGAAAIEPNSYGVLAKFANDAKILNGYVIQIEGNTDSVGDPNFNRSLSEKRAKAVAMYLQYNGGLDPTRFVIVGHGQDNPIGDNSTAAGRATNRRTDIFFKAAK